MFLLEFQCHLLMRSAEYGDIGGLQHLQEVYLVPFGDDLDQIVDVDVEKLEIGTDGSYSEVTDVFVRIVQFIPTRLD